MDKTNRIKIIVGGAVALGLLTAFCAAGYLHKGKENGMRATSSATVPSSSTGGQPATLAKERQLGERRASLAASSREPGSRARGNGQQERLSTSQGPVPALAAQELLAEGNERLADGDLTGGLEAFRSAVDIYPSSETHAALGRLYLKMAVSSRAYHHLELAAEFDPTNADRWLDLANAYYQRSELGKAWEAVKRARQVDPSLRVVRGADGVVRRASNTGGAGENPDG